MAIKDYQPPVSKLLTYGECDLSQRQSWPNYVQELALTEEHIPQLLQILTDSSLQPDNIEGIEIWALVHAWRALGQLETPAATTPLLELLEDQYNDWAHEEVPTAISLIGPPALPEVQQYLADPSRDMFGRITAITCLVKLQARHPQEREQCVEIITQQLANDPKNEPALNGFLIAGLCDLHAVEKAPEIEQAFTAQRVDLSIVGDWDETQVELGLKTRQEVPLQRFSTTEALGVLSQLKEGSISVRRAEQLLAQRRQPPKGFGQPSQSQSRKLKKAKKKR
ncbi:hypothetical protein C1752_13129 [Acaryochloris thomasi RCC1774]|uniref:HEAT repeat domain-containing protein n=1 Tax=Acaryochloris thomasi RCC1774 TaxID=1764569 RepID=A0A2W1J7D4_9CYAN|nr:DUF1186 domain-containing protein [Acaryochloris thomasi]PZD70403.1 hypothetical protein C1752_13129 [Acaryochloris thomasi RCC1774]